MDYLIGSIITVALVLMLFWAVFRPTLGELRAHRGAAHMLLIGVPALVLQTDLTAIATLAGSSMAMFEVVLVLLAF
jgi:hypothetical protein